MNRRQWFGWILVCFLWPIWGNSAQLTQSEGQTEAANFVLEDVSGTRHSLEKLLLRVSGSGVFRTQSLCEVSGSKATVRVHGDQVLKFLADRPVDRTRLQLLRFNPEPGRRTVLRGVLRASGGREVRATASIPLAVKAETSAAPEIQPLQKLAPGEYGFVLGDTVFGFAIEPD